MRMVRILAILVITNVVTCLGTTFLFYIYYHDPQDIAQCDRYVTFFSQNTLGDKVEILDKVCGYIVNSSNTTLEFVSHRNDERTEILSYEAGAYEARIVWIGNDKIVITIPLGATIERKVDMIDDIKIEYRIGSIFALREFRWFL
jgi:hypothetical protein